MVISVFANELGLSRSKLYRKIKALTGNSANEIIRKTRLEKAKELLANHKSALKRIRSNEAKRLRNKYQHKTTRNAVRDLRSVEDKKDAESKLGNVISMLDKLAKNNIIHKNKAANLKSKLTKHVAAF